MLVPVCHAVAQGALMTIWAIDFTVCPETYSMRLASDRRKLANATFDQQVSPK